MSVVQATEPRPLVMRGLHTLILLLLIPAFFEGIDDARFLVGIPGFPLTVGRFALVLAGLLALALGARPYLKSPAATGIVLLLIGFGIGALFSVDVTGNLSRTLGLVLMFAAAIGLACLWGLRPFRLAFDVFVVASLSYWLVYVAWTFISSGGASYTQLYIAAQGGLANHHVPGLYISVCGVYIALRFFYRNGRLGLGGFVVFAVALGACLIIESRSNLGFTAIALILVMLQERRRFLGRLFWAVPLLLAMYFGLAAIFQSSEGIQQRFEADRQTQATDSRLALLLAGVEALATNPLGRGILDNRVDYNFRQLNIHNQYLTYAVAGGLIALFGVFLWLWDYHRILLSARATKRRVVPEPFRAADAIMLLMMYGTLLTLEFTGLLFFLVLSVGVYRSGVAAAERRQRKVERARRRRPLRAPASTAGPALPGATADQPGLVT